MAACFLRFPGRFPPSLLFRYLLSLISTVPVLLKLIKFTGPWPWKGTLLSQFWEFTGGTFSLLILTQALCIYLLLVKPLPFSAFVLRLASWALQWIPVTYFEVLLFSGPSKSLDASFCLHLPRSKHHGDLMVLGICPAYLSRPFICNYWYIKV